jgi:hypothetical protein
MLLLGNTKIVASHNNTSLQTTAERSEKKPTEARSGCG